MKYVPTWWESLVRPELAGRLAVHSEEQPGFTRFLIGGIAVLYLVYGLTMGRGFLPAIVSGLKLPFLFLLTLAFCFPPFYVVNCLLGTRLRFRQTLRLHLLAVSVNAAALACWAPFSFFFLLTGSSYRWLVTMQVVVFATAGALSVVAIWRIIQETAVRLGRRIHPAVIVFWAFLYAFVGSQMSWALRPWVGTSTVGYQPFRPIEGSFFDAVRHLLF